MSSARKRAIVEKAETVPETEADLRGYRAQALSYAVICWRGDPASSEDILSLADEFLQYIEGDNSVMPRPDTMVKGKMPRP